MSNRIRLLEKYALENGLEHADMALLLGAKSVQAYNNWRYRNSLPKSYYDRADRILKIKGLRPEDAEIMGKVASLPTEALPELDRYIDYLLSGR